MEKSDKAEKRKAMVAGLLDPNADGQGGAKKSRLEQFGGAKPETALAGEDIVHLVVALKLYTAVYIYCTDNLQVTRQFLRRRSGGT